MPRDKNTSTKKTVTNVPKKPVSISKPKTVLVTSKTPPKKPLVTAKDASTKPKLPPKKITFVESELEDASSDIEDDEFEDDEEETLVPIKEGEDRSEFYIPSRGKYMILRTMIKPSTIKGAGMGVFAIDKIPKGAEIKYAGVKKGQYTANHYYSWEVKTYDPETGEPDDEDILYFIDASDVKYANCTRTVNCGMTKKANNMDAVQRFGKFFYVAMRDILPGEELFVDYGEQYRKVNLGMKGKY